MVNRAELTLYIYFSFFARPIFVQATKGPITQKRVQVNMIPQIHSLNTLTFLAGISRFLELHCPSYTWLFCTHHESNASKIHTIFFLDSVSCAQSIAASRIGKIPTMLNLF